MLILGPRAGGLEGLGSSVILSDQLRPCVQWEGCRSRLSSGGVCCSCAPAFISSCTQLPQAQLGAREAAFQSPARSPPWGSHKSGFQAKGNSLGGKMDQEDHVAGGKQHCAKAPWQGLVSAVR